MSNTTLKNSKKKPDIFLKNWTRHGEIINELIMSTSIK
jgi:hypothetical protein